MKQYIKPRQKEKDETETQTILRELEEYIEFAHNTKRFSDVGFYEKVIRVIEKL